MNTALRLLGGSVLSGVLLAFALPPHGWSPLGWFMFVPILVACRHRGFAVGFASAILTALIAACIDARIWSLSLGDEWDQWTFAAFLLFGVVMGFAVGLWSASLKWEQRPWSLAAWSVLFEATLLLVLPAHVALTQSRSTILLYVASWTGIWGISFLVWLVNFVLASQWRTRPTTSLALLAGCSLLSLSWLPPERGPMSVGLIQTDTEDLSELGALNEQAGREGAVIVVWPELSGFAVSYDGDTSAILKLARAKGQPTFVSTYESPGDAKPYNVARIFSAEGQSVGYEKRKLFAGESQMHSAGHKPVAAQVDGLTYGLNICFDSCYPSIMRDTARLPNVGLILLPTLDPNSATGTIQAIHAAYTPFRAAELGLPIVRADTSAYSMIVDSYGRVVAELHDEDVRELVANIQPGKRWTFVTYAGDWFLLLCVVLARGGLISGKLRRAKDPS